MASTSGERGNEEDKLAQELSSSFYLVSGYCQARKPKIKPHPLRAADDNRRKTHQNGTIDSLLIFFQFKKGQKCLWPLVRRKKEPSRRLKSSMRQMLFT